MNDRSHRVLTALGALAALAAASAPDLFSPAKVKDTLRGTFARDPTDATMATVAVSAFLFFRAEHGANPKVASFADALTFVTTSLSVGYSDIFPRTDAGKAIASAVQTFGPAMAARILDPPADPRAAAPPHDLAPELLAAQHAMIDKLDAILQALEARRDVPRE